MTDARTSMTNAIAMARAARIDPPKFDPKTGVEEKQVVVRVRCLGTMQIAPGGHLIYAQGPDGTPDNYVTMYESQAAATLALVEDATPAQRAEVERHLEREMLRWKRENPEKARDGGSPVYIHYYSAFAYIMDRDHRPFIEAEIMGPAT